MSKRCARSGGHYRSASRRQTSGTPASTANGSGMRSPERRKPAPITAATRAPPHQTASGEVASTARRQGSRTHTWRRCRLRRSDLSLGNSRPQHSAQVVLTKGPEARLVPTLLRPCPTGRLGCPLAPTPMAPAAAVLAGSAEEIQWVDAKPRTCRASDRGLCRAFGRRAWDYPGRSTCAGRAAQTWTDADRDTSPRVRSQALNADKRPRPPRAAQTHTA